LLAVAGYWARVHVAKQPATASFLNFAAVSKMKKVGTFIYPRKDKCAR
jgi:hypothetical protein